MYKRPGQLVWYAFLDYEHRHISLKTEDEGQARINLADLIHRRAAQGSAPKKGQLGAIFVECARRAKVNHTQKYAYDLNLKLSAISIWLDAQRVQHPDRVTLGLVEKFKEDQRDKMADPSINRYLDTWKKAMKLAVDEGYAAPRVLSYFRKLKEPQHEPHQRGLTMEELNAFLCAVDDERDYFLFRTVAGSGIRDDEARHLLPENVRETSIVITPLPPGACACHARGWTSKNFRYRTIPVSADCAEAARRFAEFAPTMNLEAKGVWLRIQKARKRAGIEWSWSMHDLRRAWGSHMLAAGFKLADISRWFGHGDLKTTMRYLRVVENEMPDPETLPL